MRLKAILVAIGVVAVSFFSGLKVMDWISPPGPAPRQVAHLPPLPQASRSSVILAQVAIPVGASRDAADRSAARHFAGKADNPVSHRLHKVAIGGPEAHSPFGA